MDSHDTDEWRLRAYIKWEPIHRTVQCDCCSGRGKVGGGLGDLDGERDCPGCGGSGYTSQAPKTPEPEIPPKLLNALMETWKDYHKFLKVTTN